MDERVFFTVLSVGVIASLIALGMAAYLHLGTTALSCTAACAAWFASLQFIGAHWPRKQYACRVGLICGVNFVIFPFGFLSGGGTESGMILLYLMGMFNIVTLLRRPLRTILFLLSLAVSELTLTVAKYYPDLLVPLTGRQHYMISKMFLFICALTLAGMGIQIFEAYEHERNYNRELMGRLETLSVRDPLTGLYNRRELFRRLEVVYKPDAERSKRDEKLRREGCYIAMFDIDNFKHLNDTYGHHFGDTVLSAVAHQLSDAMTSSAGELAARYGGEEFVCVLYASGMDEAFKRIDAARWKISELEWEEAGPLRVTVSGGLISCEYYPELNRAMHDVDALLYQAKHDGKNRIETQFHSMYPDKRS